MSELLAAIVTHDFMLGVGVGVAAWWVLSFVAVVWMVQRAD